MRTRLSYKKAGVDIKSADTFIDAIKPMVKSAQGSQVLGGIGGFGGLIKPDLSSFRDPVLVSSTDGVGTKLLIAQMQIPVLAECCLGDVLVLFAPTNERLFCLFTFPVILVTTTTEGSAELSKAHGQLFV